jgi:sec-independent protein translocase protein TatB
MFDIGFSEVLLIFVIALIVLGPEKLPRAASQVGRWIGRARAMARQFKEQLEEEVNLENVRKAHKEAAGREEASKDKDATGATSGAGTGETAAPVEPGAQPQIGSPATATVAPENYAGPDPADFRADTFSHAHPTNEYGANPLTPNGAPEDLKPAPATEASPVSGAAPVNESPGAPAHQAPAASGGSASSPSSTPPAKEPAREPLAATATQSDNHGHS